MKENVSKELYKDLGFIGSTDEGLTIPYVKSEIVDKADNGDVTAVFKINQIVRYSDNEEVVNYAKSQLDRIGVEEIEEIEEVEDSD